MAAMYGGVQSRENPTVASSVVVLEPYHVDVGAGIGVALGDDGERLAGEGFHVVQSAVCVDVDPFEGTEGDGSPGSERGYVGSEHETVASHLAEADLPVRITAHDQSVEPEFARKSLAMRAIRSMWRGTSGRSGSVPSSSISVPNSAVELLQFGNIAGAAVAASS